VPRRVRWSSAYRTREDLRRFSRCRAHRSRTCCCRSPISCRPAPEAVASVRSERLAEVATLLREDAVLVRLRELAREAVRGIPTAVVSATGVSVEEAVLPLRIDVVSGYTGREAALVVVERARALGVEAVDEPVMVVVDPVRASATCTAAQGLHDGSIDPDERLGAEPARTDRPRCTGRAGSTGGAGRAALSRPVRGTRARIGPPGVTTRGAPSERKERADRGKLERRAKYARCHRVPRGGRGPSGRGAFVGGRMPA
jgi:hypothetical protein